jgi:hypothetical protein
VSRVKIDKLVITIETYRKKYITKRSQNWRPKSPPSLSICMPPCNKRILLCILYNSYQLCHHISPRRGSYYWFMLQLPNLLLQIFILFLYIGKFNIPFLRLYEKNFIPHIHFVILFGQLMIILL